MGKKYLRKYQEYADQYGCSLKTIKRKAKDGWPLDDPEAMKLKWSGQKSAPAGVENKPGDDKGQPERIGAVAQVRMSKVQVETEIKMFELSVLRKEHSKNSDVRADITRIATALRGMLLRMENDLPGVLAGLDEHAIKLKVREACDKIITAFHNATDDIYLPPAPESCPPSP